ncbi:MAG: LPP20 family lipoprotein [Cytophagia bacterium]|nr:LPP20 family lipoprotein [Cytophagia bacterium]
MIYRLSIFLNLFSIGCVTVLNETPDWTVNRPVSENSWIGVGYCDESVEGYREIARTHAFQEIASQITIDIESSFTNIVTESNLDIYQFSEFIIESRVGISLPEVQILDTYTIDRKFSILAELRKKDYYNNIKLKKQKAINLATDYIIQAAESFSFESFKYLSSALEEIKPFFDLPLQTEIPPGSGEKINITSKIFILADDLKNRLILITSIDEISTTIGIKKDYEIEITCLDKISKHPISYFPLAAKMGNNIITKQSTTDQDGIAVFNLFKVTDRVSTQYIEISPDFSSLNNTLYLSNSPSIKIKVNARPPMIFFEYEELNLGKPVTSSFIASQMKELLVQTYSAEFTNEKSISDFIFITSFHTKAKIDHQNSYGLFQAYADGTIIIFDSTTNTEIYQKSINNIMGSDFFTIDGAGRNALLKSAKKIKSESFQEILTNLDDYSINRTGEEK